MFVLTESLQELSIASDEVDNVKHLPRRSDVLVAFATQEGTCYGKS